MDIKDSCHLIARPLAFAVALALAAPVAAAQSSPSARAASVEASSQVGFLVADKVYAEPDALSKEVPPIDRSVRVRVTPLPDAAGWHAVHRADTSERVGYAFLPHVSRFGATGLASYEPAPAEAERLPEVRFSDVRGQGGVLYTVNRWSNVRTGAGLEHPAFGVVRPGKPFYVLALEDGWGEVRLEGERAVGYVSGDLLYRVADRAPEPTAAAEADELPLRSVTAGIGVAGGGRPAEPAEPSQAEPAEPSQDEAVPSTAFGALTVLVRPWGSIYIDDTLHRGETDAQYSVELPVGTYRVRALHPALGAVERTVHVRVGEAQQLVLDLNAEHQAAAGRDGADPAATKPATSEPVPATPETGAARVYERAEEPPVLIGGQTALQKLAQYPEQAHTFGIEGRVLLQFVVDENGHVREPSVVRGLGMGCDEEALRLIHLARFIPAKVGGQPVPVRHALSIDFRIEG